MKIVMVDGKPQCSFCFKLFSRKHDLKRHVNNIHLKAIQYVCHLCNSQFYEAFHLTRHLRQHNSFVRCTGCMKDFSVLRDLKLHIIAIHENSAPCQCGTCGQAFQKIKYLREHMQEHDKTIIYKCHICSEEFKESRELSKHLVGHSGMYSCSSCQTTFTTEYELSNHIKCHNGDAKYEEKKYECEICHNKFKKKRYLSAHMNNRHSLEKRNIEISINRVETEYAECDSS